MNELLNTISPLLYGGIVIIIIYGIGRAIIEGEFKSLPIQIIMCCVVAYMVWKPESFRQLGEIVVSIIQQIGGSINV